MPTDRFDVSAERAEIRRRIEEIVSRNRAVFDDLSETASGASVQEYDRLLAESLRRRGGPVMLSIQGSDGKTTSQSDVYITYVDEALIEVQYFKDDGTFGEPSPIWIKDIVSIESEKDTSKP